MNRPYVYLDLDRTLFKTDEQKIIWEYIGKYFGIDDEEPYRQREKFHVNVNENYYYDFGAQLKSIGLNPDQVYDTLRKTDLANDRFLFDGAQELVRWLSEHAQPSIVTFGADDYQRFKASLCPSLDGLSIVTMLDSKAATLSTLPHEGAWLIDDKPIGNTLPDGMKFIQVSLEGKGYTPADWPIFETLRDVQEYLRANM